MVTAGEMSLPMVVAETLKERLRFHLWRRGGMKR
jgi:hypothetical protein